MLKHHNTKKIACMQAIFWRCGLIRDIYKVRLIIQITPNLITIKLRRMNKNTTNIKSVGLLNSIFMALLNCFIINNN